MNATLPLWAEYGTAEDAALVAAREDAELVAAGEELLARLEAQKVRCVRQIAPKPVKLPDYAI